MTTLTVYVDGSCNQDRKWGGWACLIERENFHQLFAGRKRTKNSSHMEIMAIKEALLALVYDSDTANADICMVTDQEAAILHFGDTPPASKPKRLGKLWGEIATLAAKRKVRWRLPHKDDAGHYIAHSLAGIAQRSGFRWTSADTYQLWEPAYVGYKAASRQTTFAHWEDKLKWR